MERTINSKMYNDASVSDWLGTAACAARVGAGWLESCRKATKIEGQLQLAEAELQQALDELREVRTFVGK